MSNQHYKIELWYSILFKRIPFKNELSEYFIWKGLIYSPESIFRKNGLCSLFHEIEAALNFNHSILEWEAVQLSWLFAPKNQYNQKF